MSGAAPVDPPPGVGPAAAAAADTELQVAYFDGQQAAARPVRLSVLQGHLHIDGEGVALRIPVRAITWPERQRHGVRLTYLPRQGLLSAHDGPAWDAWARAHGVGESWVVGWMQSWRGVALACLLMLAVLFGAYRWGTPLAAQALLALCPAAVDEQIGSVVLQTVDKEWLLPSQLPAATQADLRSQFEAAVQRSYRANSASGGEVIGGAASATPPASTALGWTLHFRATPERGIGANAFALPGGHIIVTDDMVKLLSDRRDVLIGVLGHELGHVQHRHGMRMVVQAALLAALSSAVIGDFSALLTLAPALLGQLDYSRGFEYQADQAAATLMRANGWRPQDFALLFERMQQQRLKSGAPVIDLPIGLSSHPPDAERVRRMVTGD